MFKSNAVSPERPRGGQASAQEGHTHPKPSRLFQSGGGGTVTHASPAMPLLDEASARLARIRGLVKEAIIKVRDRLIGLIGSARVSTTHADANVVV